MPDGLLRGWIDGTLKWSRSRSPAALKVSEKSRFRPLSHMWHPRVCAFLSRWVQSQVAHDWPSKSRLSKKLPAGSPQALCPGIEPLTSKFPTGRPVPHCEVRPPLSHTTGLFRLWLEVGGLREWTYFRRSCHDTYFQQRNGTNEASHLALDGDCL